MESNPTSLSHFSEHMKKLNHHRDTLKMMSKQDVLIDDIYVELKKRAPKLISTEEAVQQDELHAAQQKAEETLVTAIDFVDDQLIEMETQLKQSILQLNAKCDEVKESLLGAPYTDGDADPTDVCAVLEQTGAHLEHLQEQAGQCSNMQAMFKERREEQKNKNAPSTAGWRGRWSCATVCSGTASAGGGAAEFFSPCSFFRGKRRRKKR